MRFKISVLLLMATLFISATSVAANEASLFGRYEFKTDTQSLETLGGLVCFYPSTASSTLLHSPDDMPVSWFCFRNEIASKKMLGIPTLIKGKNCGISGHATVIVSDRVSMSEKDGLYLTNLVAVIKHSVHKKLVCGGL